MRKFHLISTVLSLFLLVPASITRAQVTKTLNGTVRYESGMSETKLSTPNGNVVMKLPQSMSGATITGTVSAEPAGKTEKEKSRNLKELLKFIVMLDGQKIPVSATPTNFDWLTHLDRQSGTPVELLNVSGAKIAELSLPPVLPTPARMVWQPDRTPLLTTPSNVLVKGDALNVYTDQQFSPGEKFVLTDSKGQQFILKPICLSSQQAVLNVPEEAGAGNYTVRQEGVDQPLPGNKTGNAGFKLIDISLSSPNTNLRNGQTSSVTLAIDTRDPAEIDSNEFLVFTVDVKNLTPAVVDMAGGNMQVISFPLSDNRQDPSAWQLTRTITGVKPGSFSVSATLHEDYNTSNDPFRPQLNVLKTPEDYNAWANALKKDLQQYATVSYDDETGNAIQIWQIIKSNTQRAIDNMPVCTSPEQLDECKAVAYSLLQPINVPKGAANTWLSYYEAFKASIPRFDGIDSTMIDHPSLTNGLDFMERLGYKNNDPSMRQDIANTRELINTIIETGESKENLSQLNQALRSLTSKTDKKLMTTTTAGKIWKLSDVLFSTYCMNKRTKDGIDPVKSMVGYLDPDKKILKVKPEYQEQILKSLLAISLGNKSYKINAVTASLTPVTYNIQLAPLILADLYEGDSWAKILIENYLQRQDTSAGKIMTTYKDTASTWYIFYKDAKCTKYSTTTRLSECVPYSKYDEVERRIMPTGFYSSFTFPPLALCRKGNDFCTEAYVVRDIRNIYMDANCSRLIKVITTYGFSCL